MRIMLGCKRWSRDQQYGFRIYAQDIQRLGSILVYPSSDNKWNSFNDFREEVVAENYPEAYSRSVIVSDTENELEVSATFATHGRTFQGYITAPLNTWLIDYVTERMNSDLRCEYLANRDQDYILLPSTHNSVYVELDKTDEIGKKRVRRYIRKKNGSIPEYNALEAGLYFETVELDRLKSEFPVSSFQVDHRYPAIDSNLDFLNQNNISCDIDISTNAGDIVKCVEVKSISMNKYAPFNLTIREWNSREWCRKNNIPYEIVVYYHFRYRIIKRLVIEMNKSLKTKPSGYYCFLKYS